MKKAYSKPEIYFDSFELSANIAAGCEVITKNQTQGTCAYVVAGKSFFVEIAACTTTPQDNELNNLCYHVPAEEYNLFNS